MENVRKINNINSPSPALNFKQRKLIVYTRVCYIFLLKRTFTISLSVAVDYWGQVCSKEFRLDVAGTDLVIRIRTKCES